MQPAGYPSLSSGVIATYDNVDGATVTVDRGGSRSVTTFDGFGRPIETASNGIRSRTRYDAQGRPVFEGYPVDVNDPDIGTTIEYDDPLGRETKRINPGGTFRQRNYGADTVTVTDEEGRSSVETQAAFGTPDDARTVAIRDADAKTWGYRYDVVGQMVAAEAQDGVVRSWVYDANHLLESEVHPESGTTTYAYTAGVLTTRTAANGVVTTFSYDGNDRLKSTTADGVVTTVAYETGTDARAWISNGSVATTFLHDSAGRLARRQDAVDGKLFNIRFEYWTDDTLQATVYPSGRRIEYQRNSAGQVTTVSEPVAGRDHAFGLLYHPSGALRVFTRGNLLQTTVTFDPQRYWVRSIASGPLQLTYDNYDAVGNVRTIGDGRLGPQTFTYDQLDRLAAAAGPYGSIGYAYDVHGNRQSNATGSYQYQPGTLRLVDQSGTSFSYDNSGNMRTAGNATYAYTPQNMLASAAVVGGTASYSYDSDLQRVKKTFAGSTTYFLRGLRGELLSEWKDPGRSGGSIRDYVYADAQLISAVEKTTTQDPNSTCGVIVPGGPAVTVSVASGQNACLTFEGRTNQLVSATITSVSPASYSGLWNFRVRRSAGTIVTPSAAAWAGDTVGFLDTRPLPADDTYTLELDPNSTHTGTVSVQVFDIVHATGFITANGQPVSVTLTTPGQNGLLRFNGAAGHTVSATMTAISPGEVSGSWYLRIRKSNGQLLTGASSEGVACCGDTVALVDAIVLPAPDEYTLEVDPESRHVGTVAVRLYDAAPATGTIVPNGGPVPIEITRPGQNGRLTFDGLQGQTVSATMRATSPGTFTGTWYLRILKPDGSELGVAGGACCGDTVALRNPVVLPSTGSYTLVVDPDFTPTGSVDVRLYDAATVTGTLTVGGAPLPRTLVPGQIAELTFSGTPGQQATVRVTGNTMGSTSLKLKRPDGSTVSGGGSGATLTLATQTLAAGTYTVTVDPLPANSGTFNLAVTTP